MSPRRRALAQLAVALLLVGVLAAAGHGRYPLWVDLMFYTAVGTLAARLTGQHIDGRAARAEDRRP